MMIRRSISIALVSVLAGALGLFTFAAPISQTTGTWHLLGSLVDARQGASATMLDDGRVLVAGGSNASGLLASAEVVSADGSSVAVAAMSVARSGHTATKLMDGRVLVTGGTGAGGAATASAEIFTPWSGTWTSVSMTVARRNHTATLIKGDSGLVVIAGGDNAGGVLSSVEVFDPAAGAFAPLAVAMSSARTRHAAAPLPDGQVIVIGGSNGPSVAGTTDIVNALTGAVFAGPSMTDARMNFTATELLNGDVLVAGGVGGANGTTELAAAEKLVVATGVFIPANGLPGPRQGHLAVRLPSNAGVLVVGGTAYGQPLRTVDLFLPESQVFRMTSPTDLEHTAGTLAPVGTGLALSAGGTGTAAMETYAFATVTTDYEDYAPGSIVTMTGTGWTPNEPVTLVLREELGAHPPRTFTAMANGLGNFTNSEFSPEEHHIGVRFFLTATQGASEAQHTFLDGVTNLAITSPTTASPVSIASGDLPEPVTVAFNYTTNGSGGTITATANVKNGATVIASNSKTIARANGGGGASESVVVTIPAGTAPDSYTVEVIVAQAGGSGNPASMTATQTSAVVITGGGATTTSIDAPPIVYDANGTVTVTVTGSSTPTGTVTLAVDGGSAVGKALTSGSATFTSAEIPALASPTAGNHSLSASYAAQDGFQASSATGALLVDKATSTTTVTCPASVTYTGAARTPCSVTVTGAGGLSLTPAPTYSNNTNAGTATASYNFAGDANHEISADTENFTIDKAQPVCTIAGYNVTYDGNSHTATGSCVGVLGETLAGLSLTGTTHTNAGEYPNDPWSFVDDTGNYYDKNGTVADAIAKASSTTTVTCTAGPFTYTGSPQTPCSVSVTGAGGLNLTPAPVYANNTNAGPATASYTFTGDTNHDGSNDSENFTIDKASSTTTVTCTGGPFVYNGSAFEPCSVSVTGAGGLNLTPTPVYANNTDAGAATASYTFTGDMNHDGSNDSENFTIDKASSTTTVTCAAGPFVYNGSAHEPCSVGVTGAGGLNLTPAPDYANNTDAGLATASYTYPGDTNHETSSDSENFTIAKASSTTTVTCTAGPFVYTGSPYTPCSVTVTGAGGLNLAPAPDYANNTDAGLAAASYTYPGDTNHETSSDSENFTITKASSTTTVTCTAGPFVYTGSPYTPCSVSVTGAGGLNETPAPVYTNNTDAGLATASYTYPGDTNHETSSDSEDFTIAKASSTTTVTCTAGPFVYTGSPYTPCSVSVTGAGGLNLTPAPDYANNTDAGLATASYTFPGDTNHETSSDSENFTIAKASSTTTVTCPANVTYTGSALTPCTVSVTGAGSLNLTPTPAYVNNTNAGLATASYTFTGDANHDGSNDSKNFTIDKASSTTTVTCGAGPFTYNGNAQTPCSATVTGANLNLTSLTPSYADNTNAGTATASYAYGGDPNHTPSSDSETFEIGKASASVAAQNKSKVFGATMTPDQSAPGDFNVTGIFAGDAVSTITLASPGYAAAAAPGSHTITPSNATGTGLSNYNIAYTNATLSVTYAYGMCQGSPGRTILNPINPDGSSVFKQKSTVPAKFRVCDANGNSVGLPGTVTGFAMILSSSGTYSDANEAPDSTTPDTAFRWDPADRQWIFNISTKTLAANKTYLFRIALFDGTFIDFAFGLK